jgi:hypothetical protein
MALPEGDYFWRVTGYHSLRSDGFVSEARPLKISAGFPAWSQAEYRFEIYDEHTLDTRNQAKGFVATDRPTFQVTEAEAQRAAADGVQLVITSRTQDADEIRVKEIPFFNTTTVSNTISLQSLSAGVYQLHYENALGQRSSSVQLRIILAPPQLLATNRDTTSGKEKIELLWQGHSQTNFYEVQADSSELFENTQKQITDKSSLAMSGLSPGKYYYRVRSLNQDRWPISRWSKVGTFEAAGMIVPLEATTPKPPDETPQSQPESSVAAAPVKMDLRRKRSFWIDSGLGMGTQELHQNTGVDEESAKYATSLAGPTISLHGGFLLKENLSAELFYQQIPGKIQTPNNFSLNTSSYLWKDLGAQLNWRLHESEKNSLDLLLGLVKHQVPFLYTADGISGTLLENEFSSYFAGLRYQFVGGSGLLYEASFRYQAPFGGVSGDGGSFKVSPQLSLDGSLGVRKYLNENWSVGLFWQGQSQKIKYDYASPDGSVTRSGTQEHMNSNIQFRLQYEWLVGNLLFVFGRKRASGINDEDEEDSDPS